MTRAFLVARTRREGLLYQAAVRTATAAKQFANLGNHLLRGQRIRRYYDSHRAVKVQFGCGTNLLDGFLNTNLLGTIPVDITRPLPFSPGSVDLFYSNHLIEHVYNRQLLPFLRNTCEALKPGGVHVIATPSLEKLVGIVYSANDPRKELLLRQHESVMGEELDAATFLNRIMHVNYGHKFLYDRESLSRLALKAGYERIERIGNRAVPDETIRVSLAQRDACWDAETETFVLTNAPA